MGDLRLRNISANTATGQPTGTRVPTSVAGLIHDWGVGVRGVESTPERIDGHGSVLSALPAFPGAVLRAKTPQSPSDPLHTLPENGVKQRHFFFV